MHDLLLARTLRYVILLIICAVTLAALLLSYQGALALIAGDYRTGGVGLGWGIGAAAAALLLIRYREDLIDA